MTSVRCGCTYVSSVTRVGYHRLGVFAEVDRQLLSNVAVVSELDIAAQEARAATGKRKQAPANAQARILEATRQAFGGRAMP